MSLLRFDLWKAAFLPFHDFLLRFLRFCSETTKHLSVVICTKELAMSAKAPVNQFSRRKEVDTFDPAERKAWMAELVHIESSQVAQSTSTADQTRNDTQYRAKSKHARKFARGVNRIHSSNAARRPSVVFNAVARAISYKGRDEIDDSSLTNTIHMHSDRVFGTTERANDSVVSMLRAATAPQPKQAAENGDATDEVRTLPVKSTRYIKGLLHRVIKNLGDIQGQAAPALTFCIPANSSSTDDTHGRCQVDTRAPPRRRHLRGRERRCERTGVLAGPRERHLRAPRLQHFTSWVYIG
jgi:hypothetical protein